MNLKLGKIKTQPCYPKFQKKKRMGTTGSFCWPRTTTKALGSAERQCRVANKGTGGIDPISGIKSVNEELEAWSSRPRVWHLAGHAGDCSQGRPAAPPSTRVPGSPRSRSLLDPQPGKRPCQKRTLAPLFSSLVVSKSKGGGTSKLPWRHAPARP